MKLSELGESAFLEQLRSRFPPDDRVPVGIGDDAAAVVTPPGEQILLTVDTLVEGTHFTRETLPPRFLGRKALAASVSDIAAMGGAGLAALLSLVVDTDLEVATLWQIVDGAAERADELEMTLVGGNVSAAKGPLVVSVTAAGTTLESRCLRRDGARAGDHVYVSGKIGASACGLELLRKGVVLSSTSSLVFPPSLREGPLALAEPCIRAHIDPSPRLTLGRELSTRQLATACIDVSDGLSVDLARLCRASGVDARIDEQSLPIDPGVLAWERAWARDATARALSGGEDYELIFTARPDADVASLYDGVDVSITKIGELVEAAGPGGDVELSRRDGSITALRASGWDHFRRE